MQNTENKTRSPKTSQELVALIKNESLAKLFWELNEVDDVGLRTFQESIHYCIYALAVTDQEDNLIIAEVREHVAWLHVLAQNLYEMEKVINAKNVDI